ncbi:MAG: TetR/AcrR family transcriptional regulator [Actinomycetota bacterium]
MSRRQSERSESTRRQLLGVARELFATRGYASTPLDEVVERAGVTKGALYHHFKTKRDLFRAVFEDIERELVEAVIVAADGAPDPLEGMRLGVGAFLKAAVDPAVRMIIFVDGPSVLGAETWREIDERYGFALVKASLEGAMQLGLLVERPVDPLAHLFLAALSEAAHQIARAEDSERATEEMSAALWALIESLRA